MSIHKYHKVGVPAAVAEGVHLRRRIKQILEQHEAAQARLEAATKERLLEAARAGDNAAVAEAEMEDRASANPIQ